MRAQSPNGSGRWGGPVSLSRRPLAPRSPAPCRRRRGTRPPPAGHRRAQRSQRCVTLFGLCSTRPEPIARFPEHRVIGNRDSVLVHHGVGSLDWAPSASRREHALGHGLAHEGRGADATALMQLSQAGKVDLDAPVQRYIKSSRAEQGTRHTEASPYPFIGDARLATTLQGDR
jgi:hypothetical protein